MLDACSVFGAAFEDEITPDKATKNQLTAALSGMVSLKPSLEAEFPPSAIAIAENLLEVVEACVSAAPAARKDPEVFTYLVDGVSYAKDACLSLCALLNIYPRAAGFLLKGPSCQQLIEALGAVHDQLLPIVENIAASGVGRGKEQSHIHANLARKCIQVEIASEVAVAGFFTNAYLDPSIEDITGGSSSSSSGAGVSGSSGLGSTKPGEAANPAAIQRGEALLHAFTLLGHREGSNSSTIPSGGGLSLGPALAQRHGIGGTIQKAVNMRLIVLDEAQTDYIAALLDVSSLASAPVLVVNTPSGSAKDGVTLVTTGADTSAHNGILSDNDNGKSDDDDSTIMLSLVSQVKDLLPEFGDGYIATCLDALDRNPEHVINALLEGNIPQEVVESVDSQLTFEKYKKLRIERVITEAAFPVLPGTTTMNTGNALHSTTIHQQNQQSKRNYDSLTAKYLDAKEASYAEKIKVAAIQSQWEYEDEYDDSYDELLHHGADGVAEGEGGGEEEEEEKEETGNENIHQAATALGGLNLGGSTNTTTAGRGGRGGTSQFNSRGGGGRSGGNTTTRGRGPRGKGGKLWVLDGRVYNYPKPGAKEVANEADAQAAIRQADQAAKEIHGLGPGGNKPRVPGSGAGAGAGAGVGANARAAPPDQHPQTDRDGEGQSIGDVDRSHGTQRGGGRGGGAGSSSHSTYTDKNKAARKNHQRKDRAAQKMSRGM
jgi:activating signal cointegrator complex subunit 2